MKYKNKAKTKIESYDYKRTIIAAVILAFFVALAIIIVVNVTEENVSEQYYEDVWQKAYDEVRNNRIGVQFEPLTTDSSEYGSLRVACNNYIEVLDRASQIDKSIDVDVTISEDDYTDTDNTGNNSISICKDGNIIPNLYYWMQYSYRKTSSEDYAMVETGPIYFNDLLLLKYINNSGDLVVLASGFGENGEPTVIKQNDIPEFLDTQTNGNMPLTTNMYASDATEDNLSELQYETIISDCIATMIKSSSNSIIKDLADDVATYFTYEGKNSVMEFSDALKLSNNTKVSVKLCLIGKSSTSLNNKDRLYIQFSINKSGRISQENIVVKLDNNLKVFDIDVL